MSRPNPKIVTRADHAIIQQKINVADPEDYAVVIQKGKGFWQKSIHVFARQPMEKEVQTYEETSSRLKFRGQKAEMEGAPLRAAAELYNKLISRTYDVLIGLKKHDQLDRQQSMQLISPIIKREAIREFIAEVYSASRMDEAEGISEGSDDDSEEDAPMPTTTPSVDTTER